MNKKYTVSKGTNDGNLAFAWQLSCNGKHVQWFSDESIARKTCDELTSIELIKENTKAETVTEFADRCRECGTHFIPISVLEDIKVEMKNLKDNRCFCHHYERGINECINVLNKHMESEG